MNENGLFIRPHVARTNGGVCAARVTAYNDCYVIQLGLPTASILYGEIALRDFTGRFIVFRSCIQHQFKGRQFRFNVLVRSRGDAGLRRVNVRVARYFYDDDLNVRDEGFRLWRLVF